MVGFLKIRGHFCQKLIFRNPDIHRKAQLFINPPAQRIRRQKRIPPERLRAAHIHKSFINTILLYTGSVFPENIHKCAGAAAVKPVMRRNHKQIRTFLTRLHQAFPGMDPAGLCGKGFGQDNAVPLTGVAAHHTELFAQIRPSAQVLQAVYRFPGQESIIYIHMKNNWFHEKSICQNICSVNRKYKGIRRHPGESGIWMTTFLFSLPLIAKERIDKK